MTIGILPFLVYRSDIAVSFLDPQTNRIGLRTAAAPDGVSWVLFISDLCSVRDEKFHGPADWGARAGIGCANHPSTPCSGGPSPWLAGDGVRGCSPCLNPGISLSLFSKDILRDASRTRDGHR
jgi:hypothetical protein